MKRAAYLLIFVIRENDILISVIRDSSFFPSVNRAKDPPVRPSSNHFIRISVAYAQTSVSYFLCLGKKNTNLPLGWTAGRAREHANSQYANVRVTGSVLSKNLTAKAKTWARGVLYERVLDTKCTCKVCRDLIEHGHLLRHSFRLLFVANC